MTLQYTKFEWCRILMSFHEITSLPVIGKVNVSLLRTSKITPIFQNNKNYNKEHSEIVNLCQEL